MGKVRETTTEAINVPRDTVLRLEELRQRLGKPAIADVLDAAVEAYARLTSSADDRGSRLTPRQRDVLRLVADGHSTKAIAAKLKISVKTAEFHRARLMRNLRVRDIAGLVRCAIRMGLILP